MEPFQIGADRVKSRLEHIGGDRVLTEPLGVTNRADVDAKPFVDMGAGSERELRAPPPVSNTTSVPPAS